MFKVILLKLEINVIERKFKWKEIRVFIYNSKIFYFCNFGKNIWLVMGRYNEGFWSLSFMVNFFLMRYLVKLLVGWKNRFLVEFLGMIFKAIL